MTRKEASKMKREFDEAERGRENGRRKIYLDKFNEGKRRETIRGKYYADFIERNKKTYPQFANNKCTHNTCGDSAGFQSLGEYVPGLYAGIGTKFSKFSNWFGLA